METFPSWILKNFIWVHATNTEICSHTSFSPNYFDDLTLTWRLPTRQNELNFNSAGIILEAHFSVIHFRGYSVRQVSCYTLLSGFRLPWPPSCCYNRPTPFEGSDKCDLALLNNTLGSSLIASSAYQKWPTCILILFRFKFSLFIKLRINNLNSADIQSLIIT
jgi:hypothetical protein